MSEKILFVDDEPAALDGYRRLLHKMFTVETAVGAPQALQTLAENGPYAVVVSDMRMPEMDGADFLAMVREVSPDTVRIAITGYANIETATRAVNAGNIFRFLSKPCEKEILVSALTAAFEQHRLVTAEKELLEKTLSGCVHVLTEMLSLVNPAAFSHTSRVHRSVQQVVAKLKLVSPWRFEVAAMLSLIGCVTLDPDLVESFYAGQKLSPEDQARFDSHPSLAVKLLANIPRMEQVAWMIANQQTSAALLLTNGNNQPPDVVIGTNILSASMAYEQMMARGSSHEQAMRYLHAKPQQYNTSVLELLEELQPATDGQEVRACSVHDLHPGMVLREEVRTHSGMLVVAKGQEITYPLCMRLKNFHARQAISDKVVVLIPKLPPVPVS